MFGNKNKPFWQQLVGSLLLWKPRSGRQLLPNGSLCVRKTQAAGSALHKRSVSRHLVGCLLESLDEQECHFPVPELAEGPSLCWLRVRDGLRSTHTLCRHVLSTPEAGAHLDSELLREYACLCVSVRFAYEYYGLECLWVCVGVCILGVEIIKYI